MDLAFYWIFCFDLFISLINAERCPSFFSTTFCCSTGDCHTNRPPFRYMPLPCCPEHSDVVYKLYTRQNDEGRELKLDEGRLILQGEDKTIFITHGYYENGDKPWIITMKDALLSQGDYNVITISWANLADELWYPQAASNVRAVGAHVAAMMEHLTQNGSLQWDQIWCIGHSLGAHICGHAGMRTSQKIGRITGLDPAGPWFENHPVHVGLHSGCALFVDVIHTDVGRNLFPLGMKRPCGHVDFYPNGLGVQPGCYNRRKKREIMVACSHVRAVKYFIESIADNPCYIGRQKCTDINRLPGSCSTCSGGTCAVMGFHTTPDMTGIIYLQTNSKGVQPYCLY